MLEVQNISFSYEAELILKNVSFKLKAGEQLAVIGESGSGKSTLLKIVYGLLENYSGNVFYNNENLKKPLEKLIKGASFMKYVSQDYELRPFLNVEENIADHFKNLSLEETKERVAELIELVDLKKYAKTKAVKLSGGQKQRLAIARAIAKQPLILLLDEPFSNIDTFRKNKLTNSLFSYLKNENISCIIASHDYNDFISTANKILVLKEGETVALAAAQQLFLKPENEYVASLFGLVNNIEGKLIYPHQLKISEKGTLKVEVKQSHFKGKHYLIEAQLNNQIIFFEHFAQIEFGAVVSLQIVT